MSYQTNIKDAFNAEANKHSTASKEFGTHRPKSSYGNNAMKREFEDWNSHSRSWKKKNPWHKFCTTGMTTKNKGDIMARLARYWVRSLNGK